MCLIVNAPANVAVPRDLITDAYSSNNDGFGLMFYAEGKVHVHKAHDMKPDQIDEIVRKTQQYHRVLHFRMATHGGIDHDNTHPFEVVDGLWMMHNGILPMPAGRGSGKSDTAVFVEDVVRPLVEDYGVDVLDHPSLVELIDRLRGSSNRLVFMDDTGRVRIMGEELGIHWRGLWCSNTYAWSLWDPTPRGTMFDTGRRYYGGKGYHDTKSLAQHWADYAGDDEYTADYTIPSTGLQVVEIKDGKETNVVKAEFRKTEPVLWETNLDLVVEDDTAEILSMTDAELRELCKNDPEALVDFVAEMREQYIGTPIDTVS